MRMRYAASIHMIVTRPIEVAFESINVSRPEAAKLSQPGIDFLKRLRPQMIETALRVHRGLYEASVAEHAEVLGHGGLRHAKPALDFPYGLL